MRRGVKVEFAYGELELFPLTLGQLRELCDDIAQLRALSLEDVLKPEGTTRLARVLAAAARTGESAVLDCIDLEDMTNGSVNKAVQTLMGLTGLKPRKKESDDFQKAPLNGADSMHVSAPPRDGLNEKSTN